MTTDTTCRRCGAAIAEAVDFCPLCGTAVPGQEGGESPADATRATSFTRSSLDDQALQALRDATLGEYEILSELGRGGMATVFLAHEIALNRKVAIKLISPHLIADHTTERFLREARTAAGLSHPNLIPIFSVRATDSLLFFVMKYVAGPSLETLLKEGVPLSIPIIQAILSETAAALGYAHRRQIVHRDVKPGNIMIDDDGRVVVTDFGIARSTESTALTGTGMSVGTPMYMSPEQCLGDPVSGASDQYSLGVVGYELLAGKVPFQAANAIAMMYAHMHTMPTPLLEARPDCPPQLAAAIQRMMEKSASDRWPSIEEANRAIGAPPLTADDPVRQALTELARASAAKRRLSLPSTPQSPMPATRSIPRRSPRPIGTPARGVPVEPSPSVTFADGAPTVRITPMASTPVAAPAPTVETPITPARRPWWIAFAALGVVAVALLISRGIGRRITPEPPAAAPPPSGTAAEPPAAGGAVPTADNSAGGAAKPPLPAVPAAASAAAITRAVPRRATAVAISPPVSELRVGERVQLRAVARDSTGRPIADRPARWSSSDPRVASVTSAGVLQGVAEGRANISVSVDGKSASVALAVAPARGVAPTAAPIASVEITPSTLVVAVGATGQLKVALRDGAGNLLTDRPVQWTSANADIADVSTTGRVIGTAAGSTQVTASAEGRSASAEITVPAPVAVAPPAPPPDPTPEIRRLIDAYVAAIHARNVARIIALYPTLSSSNRATWDKLFDDYPEVTATLIPGSVEIAPSGESAAFDVSVSLVNGRERQRILMHFQTNPEREGGAWRFGQMVQSFVKQ